MSNKKIEEYQLKLTLKGVPYKLAVTIYRYDGWLYLDYGFSREMNAEVKMMGGQYHGFADAVRRETCLKLVGRDQAWSIPDSYRSWFRLRYMAGEKVFKKFDLHDDNLPGMKFKRADTIMGHQKLMAKRVDHTHCGVFAADPGVGKTLAAMEMMEHSGVTYENTWPMWLWVGPKSALAGVMRQFQTWDANVIPTFLSYNKFVSYLENWPVNRPTPMGVVFDESHNLANPGSQRSQAAQHLGDQMRAEYGDSFKDGGPIILCMSGTPQPKAPENWWSQCEIALPGFLREGTHSKFKFAMGEYEDDPGGFKKLVAYDKGAIEKLSNRLYGLVTVVLKADCLDLPEKVYVQTVLPVSKMFKNMAKSIAAGARSKAQALILLRELSDGFQYKQVVTGTKPCTACKDTPGEMLDYDEDGNEEWRPCPECDGSLMMDNVTRETVKVPCPKDDAFRDELDMAEPVRRLVVYCGFMGSIDRCVDIALEKGWDVIRWDGRGPVEMSAIPELPLPECKCLEDYEALFQTSIEHPDSPAAKRNICFIGHPGAAGAGLTLTAAETIVYYSNDFNAASRLQSEDRIHRIGSRGARIVDLLHLPSDTLVLENLINKRELQALSLGDLKTALDMREAYKGVLDDDD